MFSTRITEVSGAQQATLERLYLRKIHEINAKIRRLTDTWADWDNADERLRAHYTRGEFWEQFVERQYDERRVYIYKLRDVRRGVLCD